MRSHDFMLAALDVFSVSVQSESEYKQQWVLFRCESALRVHSLHTDIHRYPAGGTVSTQLLT